jgi:hypothetical protein
VEFKESFPELEEAKYFIRKPKAIEDLVKTCSYNSGITVLFNLAAQANKILAHRKKNCMQ